MGTGTKFRHSCDRQGGALSLPPKDQEDADSGSAKTEMLCSPQILSITRRKHSRRHTRKQTQERGWEGGGRLPGAPDLRRDAAGSPQASRLSPRTQDRELQAPPSWKSQEADGESSTAATCPARGPGRGWSYSRRHPLDSRQKPTEKLHTSSSGVSVRLRGKRPSTSPSSSWEPGEHSRQPPGRVAGGAKAGPHPPALLRHPGGAPIPACSGQWWWGAKLPPQPVPVGSWANGRY